VAAAAAAMSADAAAGATGRLGLKLHQSAPASAQKEVLLVEDVTVSQRIAQMALSRARYKVEVASDGETAVDMYKQSPFRLVLMDIQLPRMNGIEAAQLIRTHEAEHNLKPCLMFGLTGNVEAEQLTQYASAGMNGCIAKGNVLATAVRQAEEIIKANPNQFVNLTGGTGHAAS